MSNNGYTTLNLPTALVEELKVWRLAFNNAYGRTVSYAEMIRSLLDSIPDTEPAVEEELAILVRKHPDLMEKLGRRS